MNPALISAIALVVSIATLLFTIWSRRQATAVQVAEKLTQAKLAITDVMVATENQMVNLIPEGNASPSMPKREELRTLLDKSQTIRRELNTASWPANNSSLVLLERILGSILEVSKELESFIYKLRKAVEFQRAET